MEDLEQLSERLSDIPGLIGALAGAVELEALTDGSSAGEDGRESRVFSEDEYRDYILDILREAATIEIGNGNKFVGKTHVEAVGFLRQYAHGKIDLPPEAAVEMYRHMEQGDEEPYFKDYVSEGMERRLDPLVWLAVSRPADFIGSLPRVFKALAEFRALAGAPLNDDLRMMMALRRGMFERSQLLEEPAPSEIIKRAAASIDGLFDCVRNQHKGNKAAIELSFDARRTRLTSNPDANYHAHLSMERQDSKGEGFYGWRYSIEYRVGDGRLSRHVMLYGDDFMEGKIKPWSGKDWQPLSLWEAVALEADMRDLRDVKERRPLAFLIRARAEEADFNLNI